MKTKSIIVLMCVHLAITIHATANNTDSLALFKGHYTQAKNKLVEMLEGKMPLSYERAIYIIENAYWDNAIDSGLFKAAIDRGTNIIRSMEVSNPTKPKKAPTEDLWEQMKAYRAQELGYFAKAKINWAIFTYMTDTALIIKQGKTRFVVDNTPFRYSFKDPLGTADWANTQIVNLLANGNGNCFALASLYKIFSERLNSDADICTAPGHVYITHRDDRGTYYNIEVTSKSFPGTGTMETLTYTTNDAVKNDISLRQLNLKQSVALCLVYLAKGYEYKFKLRGDNFALQCAELTLKYDSLNLNAMLLKAEVLETNLLNRDKAVAVLQDDRTFKEYQKLVGKLYVLGYREMPLEMKNLLIKGWMHDSSVVIITKNHTPKTFDKLGVNQTRYASLSWGLFDEEMQNKPTEKYSRTLFDTKRKKITQFVREDILYNDYNFDPVVFALNVDPLAHKLPGWSPYAAFADNPIMNFDKDGAFPYSVHVRSFAPFETFGGGFGGDKRGYSTTLSNKELGGQGGVTSRIQQAFIVDPTARTISGGTPWSDESTHPIFGKKTATDDRGGANAIFTGGAGDATAVVGAKMAGHLPLIPSADIDVNSMMRLTEKAGVLNVDATMNGDKFPSAEMFIGDSKGTQIMVITSGYLGDPYSSLPGDNHLQMGSGSFQVKLNDKGEFQSVLQGGKTYGIEDWNKTQMSNPVAAPAEKPMPPR
jgi:hypothetical protein